MVKKLIISVILILLSFCACSKEDDGFKYKNFEYTEEAYYDSYSIKYKSYVYEGEEYITEYYFLGKKGKKTEVILHAEFKVFDDTLHCIVYNGNKLLSDTKMAGSMVYSLDPKKSDEIVVFGFSKYIFENPIRQLIVYKFSLNDSEYVEDFIWPEVYDYITNEFSKFIP